MHFLATFCLILTRLLVRSEVEDNDARGVVRISGTARKRSTLIAVLHGCDGESSNSGTCCSPRGSECARHTRLHLTVRVTTITPLMLVAFSNPHNTDLSNPIQIAELRAATSCSFILAQLRSLLNELCYMIDA